MPPGDKPLSVEQIDRLRKWIAQGAVAAALGLRPSNLRNSPAVRNPIWARNPIDRFVLARLEAEASARRREADRHTLIRRLYLDLLGLPPDAGGGRGLRRRPAPRRLRAAGRSAAGVAPFRRAVGPALARPGPLRRQRRLRERQAAGPTPGAGATGSSGAVNGDLPFDQFTVEQFAGDLLPERRRRAQQTGDRLPPPDAHEQRRRRRQGGVPHQGRQGPRQRRPAPCGWA